MSSGGGARSDGVERLFVYGVLAVLSIGLVYYVMKFGRNVPFWDDWEMVPGLTGNEPTGWSWIWHPQNEHRIPITRLVVLVVWRLTGDLRVVMVLTSLILAAIAWLFVHTARVLRGQTSFFDAAFPLALLHWGHFENLIFAQQMVLVMAVATGSAVVLLAADERWKTSLARTVVMGLLLALTPLNGAMGIVLALPLAVWMAVAGLERWRSDDRRARPVAGVLLGSAVATIAIVATIVATTRVEGVHTPSPSVAATAHVALEVLNMGLGPPASLMFPLAGYGVAVFVALTALLGVWAFVSWPADWLRVLLLLAAIAGSVGIAVAIGHGRAGSTLDAGFAARYTIFGVTAIVLAYCAAIGLAPRRVESLLGALVFASFCAMLPLNYFAGKAYGYDRSSRDDALAADVKRGFPPDLLGRRHENRIYPAASVLGTRLAMLSNARASVFASAPAATELTRREELQPVVVRTNDLSWTGLGGEATGPDPHVVIALPSPRYVGAVEVTFVLERPSPAPTTLEGFAMLTGTNGFEPGARNDVVAVTPSTEEQTRVLWIGAAVDRIRIDPSQAPCAFDLRRVVLLEP